MEHKIGLSTPPQALHFALLVLRSVSDKLNHNSRSVLVEHGPICSWQCPVLQHHGLGAGR